MITEQEYESLMRIRKDIDESLSTTIKINHEQVLNIVIADLLSKYKHNKKDEKWEPIFKEVLRFYLSDDELFQFGVIV